MQAHGFILFADDLAWRILSFESNHAPIEISAAGAKDAIEMASRVGQALGRAGYRGEPIVLAVPSNWCLSASISTADLPKRDAKAMIFRLEEKLPVAAENLIADFIHHADDTALGIAIATESIVPIVEAMESTGIVVQTIVPASLLAAQGLDRDPSQQTSLLLCQMSDDPNQPVDLIWLDEGKPVQWAIATLEAEEIDFQLNLLGLQLKEPSACVACGLDAAIVEAVRAKLPAPMEASKQLPLDAARDCARRLLSGREEPWIHLRRGPLAIADPLRFHRRPLNAVLAAMLAVLLTIAGVLFARGERYQKIKSDGEREMADSFRRQFPGWPLPGNVRAVLESEQRKAAARTGASLPPQANGSALQTLHDVLAKVPADLRFTLERVTFEDASFQMEGQVRSYEDVDSLAASARQAGLTVDPPQARRNSDGMWSFTIHGARPGKSRPALAKGGSG